MFGNLMSLKSMHIFCALIIGVMFSTTVIAAEITDVQIVQMVNKVDRAITAFDANALAKELSDDVEIVMNISIRGKKQVLRPSKREYIDMLKHGWAQYSNYKYTRSNLKIELQGSKALVYADITESMEIQGQKISGNSREEVTVTLINGKPLVTNIVGYSEL